MADAGMLGVSKVRSYSCRCLEQSSLLLLSKTAFRALVDMTGPKKQQMEADAVSKCAIGL